MKHKVHQVNPRTYREAGGGGGGGEEGGCPPGTEFFVRFFLDNQTSAYDVFSSRSFIPRRHFETSLLMVSYYGYEI